jgi:uncharacterized protein (TIGR03086 family)
MAGIAALHRQALEATGATVAGIPADRWAAPTPATIEQVGTRLDGDVLGADPLRAYQRSAEAAGAAFDAPGALEAPCAVSYGPVPGSVYAGHRFIDVLVHGWDLAVATGQDAGIDQELARECWAVVEPQLSLLRGSGMFGDAPAALPPAGTDQVAWLLINLGRSPR